VTATTAGERSQEPRLTTLLGYRIVDTPPEQDFDDLAELAAAACDTPVASIAFVDGQRLWLKARYGIELSELPRKSSLTVEALRHADLFVVEDVLDEERHQASTVASLGFRFFAAVPLRSPEGYALGAVCVLDRRPRELSPQQADALRAVGRQVMGLLEGRRTRRDDSNAEDSFRPLVEQLLGAVYIEDVGAETGWYFSPQIETVTSYTPDEWASDPDFFARVLHPEDRDWVLEATARAHVTGEPIRLEYRLIAKEGRVVWIQDDAAVARDADGNPRYFQGLLTDITERRELTAERDDLLERLREQNERLLDVDRVKDELLATVSHELRTPLTSILGYLELVLDDAGTLTDDQARHLEVIGRNAERLLALVSDLLFVAHAQAGSVEIEHDVVALCDIVEHSVVAAQPLAARRSVELSLRSAVGVAVLGDAHRLGQVVDNLLSNAVKFTPAGGAVVVRLSTDYERAVVEVADTGPGMSSDDLDALFVRFYRTEAARKSAVPGTGLGLSIVKAIVEAHGGEIAVDTAEGEGTTFRVLLPLAAVGAAA
jgi:PAS domain S-box-containing protein